MGKAALSVGIPTVSTCNKPVKKPYAVTGRQGGATDTTQHQPAPTVQPRRDGALLNLPWVKTTSQSTLGLKVLLFQKN